MRLVAFGCSLTYGHGLADCWDPTLKQPREHSSSFAWPVVAARELNRECVNTSFPGASNKEILFKIQNFIFHPDDVVAILWTFPGRSCTIKVDTEIFNGQKFDNSIFDRIVPSNIEHEDFYKSYSETDALVDLYTRIEYANLYFNSRKITAFHFLIEPRLVKEYSWFTAQIEPIYMSEIKKSFPVAADDLHPGKLAHREFGLEVAKRINSFISC